MHSSSTLYSCLLLASTIAAAPQTPALNNAPAQLPLRPSSAIDTSASDPDFSSFPPSTASLLSLHRSLICRSSISGHELSVSRWLASYLEAHNFTVQTQDVSGAAWPGSPLRQNLYAYPGASARAAAPRRAPRARVLVTSHIDVVPPFWPYELRRGDSGDDAAAAAQVWGRGSVDAKGSVAAQVRALLELLAAGELAPHPPADVALLFVVGEEISGDGMRAFSDSALNASGHDDDDDDDGGDNGRGHGGGFDAVVFGEPTEGRLATGHKGVVGFTVSARGKAGHSGYPELGRNANSVLVGVLAGMERVRLPSSDKYGNTTVNLGVLDGGVAMNVIAERAEARFLVRIAEGGPEDVREKVRGVVEAAGVADWVDVSFTEGYGPVDLDHDIDGFETITVNYGTDVPNLKGNHKRYLYGPGNILVAHSDHEHLKVSELVDAVKGYKTIIKAALKNSYATEALRSSDLDM